MTYTFTDHHIMLDRYYICVAKTGFVMMGPFTTLEQGLNVKRSSRYGNAIAVLDGRTVISKRNKGH